MFLALAILIPLLASAVAQFWLDRRSGRGPRGDWSFFHNPRALVGGACASVVLFAANFSPGWALLSSIPTALVLGGLVAMTLNRYGPLAERETPNT